MILLPKIELYSGGSRRGRSTQANLALFDDAALESFAKRAALPITALDDLHNRRLVPFPLLPDYQLPDRALGPKIFVPLRSSFFTDDAFIFLLGHLHG